jgi:hypothetical protein
MNYQLILQIPAFAGMTKYEFMQNNQNTPTLNQEQLLQEIYENTRKTKNYMKWSLYITLVLVVLPLLAMVFILPMIMKTIGNVYTGGLLQ